MSAKYTSQKPDGYCAVRNSIYQERTKNLEYRAFEHASKLRNLASQSKENYGKRDYK